MINIVGGVYREYCMHPFWREIFGSGGRAAVAIARIGGEVSLYTYLEKNDFEVFQSRAVLERFKLIPEIVQQGVSFEYQHGLAVPTINAPSRKYDPIRISSDHVIRFGMIEGDGIIDADYVVYDPQNSERPNHFHQNGSKAKHLSIVLNCYEASQLTNADYSSPSKLAIEIANLSNAEVVVMKMGSEGALVYYGEKITRIPAFETDYVWKLGSGDCFVAFYGYFWMTQQLSPVEAAIKASKATAFYCSTKGFPSIEQLNSFLPASIDTSEFFQKKYRPMVYIAGPFFTLAELWLVDQARTNLLQMGLRVFSPYHDVGHGSAEEVVESDLNAMKECDIVFAIGDGLDAGTLYEVGYARSIGKPVVFYSENESDEDKKMMLGSGCIMCADYVTSIYKTLWAASEY